MKIRILFMSMILSAALLQGCSTTPAVSLRKPEFSTESSVTIGQSMYTYDRVGEKIYDYVNGEVTELDQDIKYEFLYSGFSKGTLRATYREFVNDMARPAFSQEATYDFTPGTPSTISFKGAQIEVLDANNNEIRYRVLRGFDGEEESDPAETTDVSAAK